MKLKLLLSTSLLLGAAYLTKAQTYGQWQGATAATSFDYNIAVGTLGASYAASATAKSSESTSITAGYLGSPASGTARVFTSANGGGGFVINSAKLVQTASLTDATLNKFALHSIANTSAVTSIFLKIRIESSPNGGTAIIGFGKAGESVLPADDVFTNDKQANVAVGAREPGLFGAIRLQPGNSQTNTGVRYLRTSDNTFRYTDPASGGTSYTAFPKATDFYIEIYCNNSVASRSYTRNSITYTLPSRTYNIFSNDILLTALNQPGGTLISNIPSTELDLGEKIDAIFIATHNAASNQLITSVSDVKFGWVPQNVLPVELGSFTGKKISIGAQLNWSTAAEKDNAYFEVLRASENGVFKAIDRVDGKGNSNVYSNYQFVDNNPLSGNNYYKLKQVDRNGDSKEYGPVIVNFDLAGSKLAAFVSAGHLLLNYEANESANAEVMIIDLSGKTLISRKVGLVKGLNQAKLDVSVLPKGLYVVKIGKSGNSGTAKFIK